ncbi:LAQU0S04e06546g1_1 [Lachancea quebecensis]|uniref:LAQU0S04e06546g1_1 n=1 Tax=Lachancea quebecensis TaxID=1654605 RepID=A0A0N7MLE1_9SACH|nr:LAQU0S04e06546g1_1 [Lachancea quebecensis]
MSGIIDWLPRVDGVEINYRIKAEELVELELQSLDQQDLHPDVAHLIGQPIPARRSHELGAKKSPRSSKRPAEGDVPGKISRRKVLTDFTKESGHHYSEQEGAIVESYLGHQLSVLERLLPRTLAAQWATNNEYMSSAQAVLAEVIEAQEAQLRDLDAHRESLQEQEGGELAYLEQQWRDVLVQNVERVIQ